ncbi:hypothetical protein M407DRAFT_245660 [Tulasnella calospora MUT 4182]|uniref:Uncharacterized protein n=1 Tax=Tulasnella calospora MUT 4182 TaxID=1051891 RepID=A0A0C3QA26_9AGAM|nr:hypothetical protein M407DRAFT_245660 [Tulasnella calospora MUT 4182]
MSRSSVKAPHIYGDVCKGGSTENNASVYEATPFLRLEGRRHAHSNLAVAGALPVVRIK